MRHGVKHPPGIIQGPESEIHVDQVVKSEGICSKPEFKNVCMELLNFLLEFAGPYERGEGERVGCDGTLQHVGVEEEGEGRGVGNGEGFEESVVEEGVGVGKSGEEFEGVVEVAVLGEGAEGEDARHRVVVGRESQTEEERMVLLRFRHA